MKPVAVQAERVAALARRMAALGVREPDLIERFLRGGGPGGQKINKTSSCVVLYHSPSGVTVRCEQERSQAANRYLARLMLCERLETLQQEAVAARRALLERTRRQSRRPPRQAQMRRLRDKRFRSQRKAERRPPPPE